MATKTILIDDLDGTDAFRTVRWSFDGTTYEIDLSREHLDAFKHGLAPWANASRQVSKYKAGSRPGPSTRKSGVIRAWGLTHGWPDLPAYGPLPPALKVAYEAAHAKPVQVDH